MATPARTLWHTRRVRVGIVATAVLVASLATVIVAQTARRGPAGSDMPESGRYLEPVFDDVVVTEAIPYHATIDYEGNPITLHLDLYEPAGDLGERRPVIMWMHGGGFVGGDRAFMARYAEDFARRGYVAVSIQYRLRPGAGDHSDHEEMSDAVLDAFDDSLAALAWLRDHADDHRIDPDAIAAGGYSAGAIMAEHLAYLPGDFDRPADPTGIAAAVSISGLTLAVPQPGDPPVIAFHGTEDIAVEFAESAATCETARDAGLRFELIIYEGAGHEIGDIQFTEIGNTQFTDIVQRTSGLLAEVVLAPAGFFGQGFEPEPPPQVPCSPG